MEDGDLGPYLEAETNLPARLKAPAFGCVLACLAVLSFWALSGRRVKRDVVDRGRTVGRKTSRSASAVVAK